MDTTVKALQNLYAALGGTATDVENISTIPDMINAIATHIGEGGAAELPAVNAADNGKVLTVVSGKWAKAAVPTELPAVTTDDNGKVLKVASGAWAVGTDNTSTT